MKSALHPASDRIYRAIKRELLDGAIRPGERIDAVGLAQALGSSLTPVRAALHRLVGERLVELRPSEGFHTRIATEAGLRDLYLWNGRVISMAVRLVAGLDDAGSPGHAPGLADASPPQAAGPSVAELFERVGRRSRSEACLASIQGLNDQLHSARRAEAAWLRDAAVETAALAKAWSDGDLKRLERGLRAYHARRMRAVPDLIRLMHGSGD